jgi:hypothetical protein
MGKSAEQLDNDKTNVSRICNEKKGLYTENGLIVGMFRLSVSVPKGL